MLRSVAHLLLDAPADGNLYGRENGTWMTMPTSSGGIPEAPADGQIYGRRGSSTSWLPMVAVTSGPPASPALGQLWWDSTDGNTYLYYNDGSSTQWVPAVATAVPAVTTAAAAPTSPAVGQMWWDSSNGGGNLYLYYNDGTSTQWVPAVATATPSGGPYVPTGGGSMTGALNWIATGSVTSRSAQDRSTDVINVLDYGAVGDGATDATSAIQAALNYSNGRHPVLVPNGTFVISATLAPPSGTHLIINGTLFLKAASNCIMISATGGSGYIIDGGGTLNANRSNQAPGTGQYSGGVQFLNASSIAIRDLTINNSVNWPVNIVNSSDVILDNLNITNAGSSVEFAAGSSNCWASRLLIQSLGDESFAFYGGVYNSGISNSIILNGTFDGISVLNDNAQKALCHHILIEGCIVTGCGVSGVSVTQGTGGVGNHHDITISNNLLYGNNQTNNNSRGGVFNLTGDRVNIFGNIIHSDGNGNNSSFGVYVGAAVHNCTVRSNTIYNEGQGSSPAAGTGIYHDPGAISTMVASNKIFDNQGTPTMLRGIAGGAGSAMALYANTISGCVTNNAMSNASDTVVIDQFSSTQVKINPGIITDGNVILTSGGLFVSAVNAATVLGATTGGGSGTPYVDFHSSGNSGYDARLMASGGTGNADAVLNAYGSVLNLVTSQGLQMTKGTITETAPGANNARLRFEVGTNAGTAKLVAYAGTSTTGVTVLDNIGAGF